MVGIADPLRPEAARVIKEAGEMGVKVVVITGDNELTAKMIAREAGLIHQDEEIMSGDSLEKITDEALIEHVSKIRIFARISPDQKLRIVKALQRSGEVVVMTGDGVNDALAIKQADVGVASISVGGSLDSYVTTIFFFVKGWSLIKSWPTKLVGTIILRLARCECQNKNLYPAILIQ
jgi:magnesium-transporting ATPase (P-type)